jgi:hypothetical protein
MIEHLRGVPSVELHIVDDPGSPRRSLPRIASWIYGADLRQEALRADAPSSMLDRADVIIDLSHNLITARPLGGIWRFRLDDSDDISLPFAREFAADSLTVDAVLYRHRNGANEELRRGRFGRAGSYAATVRLTLDEVARWPATCLSALLQGALPCEAYVDRPRTKPLRALARFRFLLFAPAWLVFNFLRSILVVNQWNVGFAHGEARELLTGKPLDVHWLPDPAPHTFLADPFLVERDGIRALFVEGFDYGRERGVIDVIVLDADGMPISRERAIDGRTHLSYPFPLEIDGELYLVPENAAANEVTLYRCVQFPTHWERESALFPSFDGVDTTIFPHGDLWWAMCSQYSRGSNASLFAYFAPLPRGPWTPHLLNPIVIDVGRARPAGSPFVVDAQLYRPGQDCSQTYGGAVVISHIDCLTPTEYRETVVARVEPAPAARYRDGLHTVGIVGQTIIVDGKRTYFDLRYLSRLPGILWTRYKFFRLRRTSSGLKNVSLSSDTRRGTIAR